MTASEQRADRRRELRRGAILETAAAELAQYGYDGATWDRIGERTGSSKASLYLYVTGKHERRESIPAGGGDRSGLAPLAVGPTVELPPGALNGVPGWLDPDGPPSREELSEQVVSVRGVAGR